MTRRHRTLAGILARPLALALAGLAALAACAPPATITADDIRRRITRAQLDSLDAPLLLVDIPALGTAATMEIAGRNDGVVTWRTADNVHLSFRDGVLVATRGLTDDMMSADIGPVLAALDGAPGPGGYHERLLSRLDGTHRTVFRAFQCRITGRAPERIAIVGTAHAVTRITEHCVSPGREVTNLYWLGADGVMWKSRQWIGPRSGHVETERLVR